MLSTTAVLFVVRCAAALEQLGLLCALLKANLTSDLPEISLLSLRKNDVKDDI